MRARLAARRDDARGAVAVLLALVLCFVLFPLASLAVDIGMQRIARKDMQAVADLVALDMARKLAGGTTPTDALATTAAGSTQGTMGARPTVKVYSGYILPTAAFVSNQARGCGGAGSVYDPAYFQNPSTAGKPANAVLVTATTAVDFSLRPGSGGACRSAVAGTVGAACYSVGSYAAAVSSSNSVLLDPLMRMLAQQSGAFSNSASVMALGYQGLATSRVDLGRLATGLRLASINELATANVKLHDLYVAALGALVTSPTDTGRTTNIAALNTLISTTTTSAARVDVAKILSLGSNAGAVAGASMNLLDLVGGSLGVINGTNVASLNIAGGLPGLINTNLQVRLIQGAHQFCGGVGDAATTATSTSLTEQLKVTATTTLNPSSRSISVPGIPNLTGATTASVSLPNNVDLSVSVAPTSTTLKAIQCGPTTKGVTLGVSNGLATVTFKTYLSNLEVNTDLLNVRILGVPVASLNAKVVVNTSVEVTARLSPSGPVDITITVPNQAYETAYPTSNSGVSLGTNVLTSPTIQIRSNVTLLGIINAGAGISLTASEQNQILNNVVSSVISPLFDANNSSSLVRTAINPILGMLGTQVGGANVILHGTPPPSCNRPVLKG